jgi:hypothetical protein
MHETAYGCLVTALKTLNIVNSTNLANCQCADWISEYMVSTQQIYFLSLFNPFEKKKDYTIPIWQMD